MDRNTVVFQTAAELACNDDVNTQAGDLSGLITLELDAGQSIYLY